MGSSEAAFCGVLQSRRDDASRWARPRRPRTAHSPCSCARLLLFAAAPAASLLRFPPRFAFRAAHSCARVPSAPVSSVPRRLVPRRRALYPALFLRGRTHRAVLSPFPSHAARLSCPVPPVRPACAHRVEVMGEAPRPHARPALKQRTRNRRPASASPRARPVRPPRTPGTSVPPRTPGASVPPLAAVRFGSHSSVQSLPIFFHRPAGKRTRKANLIRTYVRIRF